MQPVALDCLYIHIGHNQRRGTLPTLAMPKHRSVLGYKQFGVEGEVGRRFAETGRRIGVSTHTASRLLLYQIREIGVFTYQIGTCRKIHNHLRPGKGQITARRHRDPQILAYLGAERHTLVTYHHTITDRSRIPPAALVELVVIRHISLGHNGHHTPLADGVGGIVERLSGSLRRPYKQQQSRQGGARLPYSVDTTLCRIEQHAVMKKIAAGISGNTHFREHKHVGPSGVCRTSLLDNAFCISRHIGHPDSGRRTGHPEKSIFHNRLF